MSEVEVHDETFQSYTTMSHDFDVHFDVLYITISRSISKLITQFVVKNVLV